MEVPVINRLSNFDGGHVTCLQNPSLLSQILSIKAFQAHSFWKWSAFIIAMIASFGTLITRIRIIIIRLQCHYCSNSNSSSSEPLLRNYDDSLLSDYSDDDEIDENDAVSWSSVSDFDDDDDDDDAISTASFGEDNDQDFHVSGSGYYGDHAQGQISNFGLRRGRFSWSDFSSGNSVVKLWDSFGLAYDEDEDEDELDANATSSPVAMLSGDSGRVRLGVWDARVGCRIPTILAEWGPQFGRIVGCGGGKVYVRDDVTGDVAIGDVRRFDSPYGLSSSDSAVTRCCDAVKSYLL